MADVDDVAAEVLRLAGGRLDTFKLQKLVYYCQAWHLVWNEEPLFTEPIEAWAGGPVVPRLYDHHRGLYTITSAEWKWGNIERLSPKERETIRIVVEAYGQLTGRQLSTLTHREEPWRQARVGLGPGERGNRQIQLTDIYDYYSALDQDEGATPVEELPVEDTREGSE